MSEKFDVFVVGGGPGGYAAAIRCAQKGVSVAIAEKGQMGGTCLNRGCIPSKALLGSAHFLVAAKHAGDMGVEVGEVRADWGKMQERKNSIVSSFRTGVSGLVKSNKIKLFAGKAIVVAPGVVKVETSDGEIEVGAKKIILATGSEPVEIPAFPFDGETVISSTEVLSLSEIPASMVIIGGGVIGCELACVYAAVGTKVTIVEALDRIIANEDAWVGKLLAREFKKQGIVTLAGKKVVGVDVVGGGGAEVSLESGEVITAAKVLVAVGRRAVCDGETTEALALEMAGMAIAVNKKMETNVGGVYAIGDAVGTTYLAHGAFLEAEIAAENACGGDEEIGDYSLVPRAVYTFPEVASVGLSEAKCGELGIEFVAGKAAFRTNGRSVAHNDVVGEVRVIRGVADDRILGVTMVGATVTELISTARALLGTTEKITEVCLPHPTVSEVLKEAWEDAFGISLHVPPRRK